MRFKVFSSGSYGNSTVLKINDKYILIDVGLSRKHILSELEKLGLSFEDISFILITHEHSDHIKGLAQIIKDNIPIYMTKGTFDEAYNLYKKSKVKSDNFAANLMLERFNFGGITLFEKLDNSILYKSINIEGIDIDILPCFHDAAETCGFVIHEGEKKLVYITDTGYVHEAVFPYITNADIYILESNYDPEVLMASSRPYLTKKRILSDNGHMSNEDSMVILSKVIGNKTKYVLHAHVSQECNIGLLIEQTRKNVFNAYNVDTNGKTFVILGPYPSEVFDI